MRVLVTGGAGYLGTELVGALCRDDISGRHLRGLSRRN